MPRGFALLCGVCVCSLPLFAQDAGKIDKSVPTGLVIRGTESSEAKATDALRVNDVVRTNEEGRLQIALKDGSTLTAGPRTEMRVVTHDLDTRQSLIELLHGRLRAQVAPNDKPTRMFAIHTPTALVVGLGTTLQVQTLGTTPAGGSALLADASQLTGQQNQPPMAVAGLVSVLANRNIKPGSQIVVGADLVPAFANMNIKPRSPTVISSLTQLTPGAAPGTTQGATLADYQGVEATFVLGLDHFTAVANVDRRIPGVVYLLPGEYTFVEKDKPPTSARRFFDSSGRPAESVSAIEGKYRERLGPYDDWGDICGSDLIINGKILASSNPQRVGKTLEELSFRYRITGTGTSTGNALQLQVWNDSSCPLNFLVTDGAVLHPKGFTERLITGLIFGNPPLKDFQKMATMGGMVSLAPSVAPPPRSSTKPTTAPDPEATMSLRMSTMPALHSFLPVALPATAAAAVPPGGEATMFLRSYCLELHKLAPHPKTEYKFADEGEQEKLGTNYGIVDRAFRLVQTREIKLSQFHNVDSVIQWSLWASLEGMDQKKFHEEYFKLVRKNYEAKKMKWDKDAERMIEASAVELWSDVQRVLGTKGS